jgi:hypothetical protein
VAEAHASLVSSVPMYRGRFPGGEIAQERAATGAMGGRTRKSGKKAAPRRKKEEQTAAAGVSGTSERRDYNREYMRLWRKRNQERYRVYNREYQRKRHIERKIARILRAPAEARNLCGYGCGRAAVETVERTDPRTWKAVQIPYCGHC